EDVGQHVSDRGVERCGNLLVDLGAEVDRARQRWQLDHFQPLGLSQLAHVQRRFIDAAGDDERRLGLLRVVFQGHCVVRRVDDHHVGVLDHPADLALGQLALQLLDARLHFGAAFLVLVFLLALLLGHAHFFQEEEALQRDIDKREQYEYQQQRDGQVEGQRERTADGIGDVGALQRDQLWCRVVQLADGYAQQRADLQQRLEQLGPVLRADHPAQPRDRVELAELRGEVLRGEHPATRHQREGDDQDRRDQQRQQHADKDQQVVGQDQLQVVEAHLAFMKVDVRIAERLLHAVEEEADAEFEYQQRRQQRDRGGDVLGAGDLAIVATLLELLLGGLFGLVLGAVLLR